MTDDPDNPPPLFDALPPLSDEAAAAVADCLAELLLQFESRHLGQILRYQKQQRPPPPDPRQPWLTGLPPPDVPF